jgi:hypothetical protein
MDKFFSGVGPVYFGFSLILIVGVSATLRFGEEKRWPSKDELYQCFAVPGILVWGIAIMYGLQQLGSQLLDHIFPR